MNFGAGAKSLTRVRDQALVFLCKDMYRKIIELSCKSL